jgi:hypothetical protein
MTEPGLLADRLTTDQVWQVVSRASFAVISHVNAAGEPRSSGVVYGTADGHLYVVVGADSWKARQIIDGACVAVTVPVRRGGLLSLIFPIPPATVSFRTRAIVHPPGSLNVAAVSERLASSLPEDRGKSCVLELIPDGSFLTYGVGVRLMTMRNPTAAQARIPVR